MQVDQRLLQPDRKQPLSLRSLASIQKTEQTAVLPSEVVGIRKKVERGQSGRVEFHVLREVVGSNGEDSVVGGIGEESEVGDDGRESGESDGESEFGCREEKKEVSETSSSRDDRIRRMNERRDWTVCLAVRSRLRSCSMFLELK